MFNSSWRRLFTMSDLDFDGFEEWFYHDLEKAFSADIACCNHCYADFLAMWPHAYNADNSLFQTTEINLDWFYEAGYLKDEFSKDEFDRYIAEMRCPRCRSFLSSSIWAYNFPFNIPEDFEETIREVSELASWTPFLLLENKFCKQVLAAVRDISKNASPKLLDQPLFRGRTTSPAPPLQSIDSFDFPPAAYVREGRYNHAGAPVLYLASDKETCQAELRGSECLVLEFTLLTPIRILDLTDPYKAHQEHSDLLDSLVYSALVSAKQRDDGWHKPHYVVARFVADCARSAGFDAVKYPSTRRTRTNFNLVLVNSSKPLATCAQIIAYHQIPASKS
jgi:RES domain-containing protein